MKKLAFIFVLVVVIGICFTVSAFAGDFYVIPVKKGGVKVTSTIVPKTGETQCYYDDGSTPSVCTCGTTDCTEGQDGEYQMGNTGAVAPASSSANRYTVPNWTGDRFTDNNDGTVTDNLTTLIWLKNANSLSGETNWASALNYCNNLDAGGHTDWRLPNFNEFCSLDDPSDKTNPCLPSGHPFTNVPGGFYWSSTTYASITIYAWDVQMYNGLVGYSSKGGNNYVWPVRSDN